VRFTRRNILIIAFVLAGVTAYLAYYLIASFRPPPEKMATVVVAMEEIPANVTLTREMVSVIQVPEKYAHPQAIANADQIVGKISKTQLYKDEQILSSRLASKEQAGNRFAYRVPDKMRAITLAVTEVTGIAGLPTVGDRVDVLISRQQAQPAGTWVVATAMQSKEILATGGMMVAQEDGKQRVVPTITLSLSPQDAQQLFLLESTGKIRLTLRSPVDKAIVIPLEPITWRP
jgi:pilus assembly protein CpaB